MDIVFKENDVPPLKKILDLYESVGWSMYSRSAASLEMAIRNSTYVIAAYDDHDDSLIGLIRSISDDVSILLIKDIVVASNYQKQGIGQKLLSKTLDHFSHVSTHALLIEGDSSLSTFFETNGFKNIKDVDRFSLSALIKMKDIDLD